MKRDVLALSNGTSSNSTDIPFFLRKQLFSPAVLMGIVTSIFTAVILIIGVCCLASIQTPTRFQEQPKIKKQ
jgi:hypothetical protein